MQWATVRDLGNQRQWVGNQHWMTRRGRSEESPLCTFVSFVVKSVGLSSAPPPRYGTPLIIDNALLPQCLEKTAQIRANLRRVSAGVFLHERIHNLIYRALPIAQFQNALCRGLHPNHAFRKKHNPLFALIVGSFSVVTRQTWRIGWDSRSTDAERLANVDCHARIAAAIEAREPRMAEAAMAEHFDNSVRALLSAGVI